ncbi:MAG TPA: alpha-amylase family protein [Chryseolinea sp.]|nr:alpha-amylase family protein [Chryseolinea sp.]
MSTYWYKNAIIYSTHLETFMDSDGDGTGDFKGMTRSLDYLSGLGITCIWLLPFFPSPNRDHGYDISDYLNVDPTYGTLGHFVEFLDAAEQRGIRVIIDLVLNHTSVEHPWFQEARKSKDSKYHNYYIWLDEKPENSHEDIIFAHHQDGNWEYDHVAGRYYYHTFYQHQADLNLTNPQVQEELQYILHFWLKLGIAGFRMDAVPHMMRNKGNEKFDGDPFQFLRDIRSFVAEKRQDAVLLAEVDTEPEKYEDFFGKGDQVQMLLNFYVNNHIFLALATKKAAPLERAFKELPQTTVKEQMGIFIRNHDELDLERLTEKERNEVYEAFAPDENMRIYGRGIRRRLAPMLQNNRKWIELTYSLLFSLPGTPVFRYGDELGMGEDLSLPERNSVRTAMQWSTERHGGFSAAEGDKIPVPVISDGEYGFKKINVHDQMRNPNSLLNWVERAISVRKECAEFGWGDYEILKTGNPAVFAHACFWKNGYAVAVHNFSDRECNVKLEITKEKGQHLIECFSDQHYDPLDESNLEFKIGPFGYRWFRKSALFL